MEFGHEQFDELAALVASGAATVEEEQHFDAHLAAACPYCNTIFPELCHAISQIPKALPVMVPPPSVRDRLIHAIRAQKAPSPQAIPTYAMPESRPSFSWFSTWGWALAAFFGIAFLWNLNQGSQKEDLLTAEISGLQQKMAEKEEQLTSQLRNLETEKMEAESALRLIEGKSTYNIRLSGETPDAFARIIWNPETNAGLAFGFGLPTPPSGLVYQLWAIQNNLPVDAGVFRPQPEGSRPLKIKSLPDPAQTIQFFAITLEPEGGSPAPTSAIVLKGIVDPKT
ncbi:MAG: anti-sigma factor [Nitrospirota bacterium]